MKRLTRTLRIVILAVFGAALLMPQAPIWPSTTQPSRLPNGRSQKEAIIKDDHKKSLEDVDEILKLATALKKQLEEKDYHVVSLSSVRSTEKIEDLAKDIRNRLKRY